MTAALAVLSAALTVAGVPPRGLALETNTGVELQTLSGRTITTLAGMHLATDQAVAHKLVVRDRRGRLFVVDGLRLRPASALRGCRPTDVDIVVCARTIMRGGRVMARAPGKVGHWVWAERAPAGRVVLAQWSAACEIPVAYLVDHGRLRPFGRESVALGWLPTGEAVIHFPNGPCAGDSRSVRGIYGAVSTTKMRLILRTKRFAQYAMWGG